MILKGIQSCRGFLFITLGNIRWDQGSINIFYKGLDITASGFVDKVVFVLPTQLCQGSMNRAIDIIPIDECHHVPGSITHGYLNLNSVFSRAIKHYLSVYICKRNKAFLALLPCTYTWQARFNPQASVSWHNLQMSGFLPYYQMSTLLRVAVCAILKSFIYLLSFIIWSIIDKFTIYLLFRLSIFHEQAFLSFQFTVEYVATRMMLSKL